MISKTPSGRRMRHLFGQSGEAALAEVMRREPLLGFDFDGTLAPIVTRPDKARVSQSVAGKLRRLAARLPVAIVSGRAADDVMNRLDFEPYRIVGNHGADLEPRGCSEAARRLDGMRGQLAARARELEQAGVAVEDKGLSIALHYRLSPRPGEARALVLDILQSGTAGCHVFPGKMVENIVPAGVPDKGSAMHRVLRECGAACAFFVGDDANDEPVFTAAADDWLTVRIGRHPGSRADYFLDSSAEVGLLLDRLIAHAQA